MRSYLNGTWSSERDGPLPDAAAIDAFLQRYGWTWQEYQDTPEAVIQELSAVMAGEADHHREEAKRNARHTPAPSRRGSAMPTAIGSDATLRDAWDSGLPLPGGHDPLMPA
jgi:hypothetical protein